jgi:hypothetical protein
MKQENANSSNEKANVDANNCTSSYARTSTVEAVIDNHQPMRHQSNTICNTIKNKNLKTNHRTHVHEQLNNT